MRVLVLGGAGMLGHKLVQTWKDRFDVWATLRGSARRYEHLGIFDLSRIVGGVDAENFDSIVSAVGFIQPQIVVNCIGVIKQLPTAKDPITTLAINSIFPHRLANLCRAARARLISLSTDCVFSGRRGNYSETDTPDAEDLYGQSKRWGEVAGENCLTLRTSIIGRELQTSHSLVEWFLSNRGKQSVRGFTRAIYSGFPTVVLADILSQIIEHQPNLSGVWHVSSEPINKFELLRLINNAYNAAIEIEPDDDFAIDRSLNSEKFRRETNFQPLPWQQMISRMATDDASFYDELRRIV